MMRTLVLLAALVLACSAFTPMLKQGQQPYFCNGPMSYYNDPVCCPDLEVLMPHFNDEDYCPTAARDPAFCTAFVNAFVGPNPTCKSFIDFLCDMGLAPHKSQSCDAPCGVSPFEVYNGCFAKTEASAEEIKEDKRLGQTPPASWHCSSLSYGTGDGCDCECGATDPDCADPSAHVWGCFMGETCTNGHCFDTSEWTCPSSYFASGDGCDCNCGIRDPDCDNPSQRLYHCASGEVCSDEGKCIGQGWTCPNSFYGSHDGCDCNCGTQDPDCSDPSQTIHGCWFGQVCRGGRCVMSKEFNSREELKYAESKTSEPARSESARALPLALGGALALVAAVAVAVVAVQRRRRSPMASLEGQ